MSDHDQELEKLEHAIVQAEEIKREFVKDNPNGAGDKDERNRLYTNVERARRALRNYKVQHHLV